MRKKKLLFNGDEVGEIESNDDFESEIEQVQKLLEAKGFNKQVSETDMIHGQANSFAEVANEIYNQHLNISPFHASSAAPFVVNAVFSIELYLKTMRSHYGEKVRGHNLTSLYNGLRKEAKNILLHAAEDVRPHYDLEPGLSIIETFGDLSRSFEQWRYLYENNGLSISIQPVRFAMHVCHEACCRIAKRKVNP